MKPSTVTILVAVLVAVPVICLTRRLLPALVRRAEESREDWQNRRYDTGDCMT